MRLPSFQQIARESARTLRRFPFALFAAAAGTAAALLIVEDADMMQPSWAFRVLLASALAIPFLTGLTLFAEKRRWNLPRLMTLQALGILLLTAYAVTLPSSVPHAPEVHLIRFMMLAAGMILFVAIAPWFQRGQVNGFWQYNKTLLLRIITSVLFVLVLYGGLAIALAAVENLFDVDVPGRRYFQLWIVLNGLMTTWFFLAGIPGDLEALDQETEYPRGLKIFAQYVLLPIVLIYLVILTTYTGKIILTWTWPIGWISRLILGFSAAGMLTLLLLHPVRELPGNRWISVASRWFYVVLAPLVLVYFLALFRRLSEYGVTEGRYFGIVTGGWLAAMVLYFLLSRAKSIKAIPITLCTLLFLMTVGPWGAFSVSENSQVARLKGLLEKNGMLVGGKVRKPADEVPFLDAREISAALSYLHDAHGYGAVQPWFTESLAQDSIGARSEWQDPSTVASIIGVEFVSTRFMTDGNTLNFNPSPQDAMIVSGYERALPDQYLSTDSPDRAFTSGEASYTLSPSLDTLSFVLSRPGLPEERLAVRIAPVIDSLTVRYHGMSASDVPLELMSVEAAGPALKLKLYVLMLRLKRDGKRLDIAYLRLRVLYALKQGG